MASTGDSDRPEQGADPSAPGSEPAIRENTLQLPQYVRGRAHPAEGRGASKDPGVGWPDEADEVGHRPDAPRDEPVTARRVRGGCLFTLAAVIVVIAALVVGVRAAGFWPHWSNPFAEQKTDRSQPPLLKSIQDLSRFTAAQGNFQVVVDLQNDRKYVPDFLLNHRTLFVGVGSVEAYVDFSTIGEGAVVESADGTSVEVKLPAPQLGEAHLNIEDSYVFAEQRGLFNRIHDAFAGDANRQRETYRKAQDAITQAAKDTELAQRAQENTRKMLEGLLGSLGYQKVTITFATP